MTTIAVIGLGYVGLPLAVEFGKKFRTVGFDLSAEKVAAYREFNDPTGEVSSEDLRAATQLTCHTDPAMLREADFVVINPACTPLLARKTQQAASLDELLFAMIVLGDDRLIERTVDIGDTVKPGQLIARLDPQNEESGVQSVRAQIAGANARLLESVLDDFHVKGQIVAVRPGPVVTMYELEPAPGTKASRVIGLADDIARNMSAISARVSSIPGRTVMGIELPNATREKVVLREIIAARDPAKIAINSSVGKQYLEDSINKCAISPGMNLKEIVGDLRTECSALKIAWNPVVL